MILFRNSNQRSTAFKDLIFLKDAFGTVLLALILSVDFSLFFHLPGLKGEGDLEKRNVRKGERKPCPRGLSLGREGGSCEPSMQLCTVELFSI